MPKLFKIGDRVMVRGSWLSDTYGVGEIIETSENNIKVLWRNKHLGAFDIRENQIQIVKGDDDFVRDNRPKRSYSNAYHGDM